MAHRDHLGPLEVMAMLAVLRRGNNAYGREIQEELRDTVGREIVLGAIYTTLARLEEKGHVSSRLADAESDRMGRPRRFFKVEGAGLQAIREWETSFAALRRGLRPILEY